ncbi:MAG TPA: chemotaxis protein CheW [Gemmatimonadaceae bacterium]|jgi:chemotaxis signal transduction protein|nr:chemotaxis protein CheW [Gemmatimonadaceae bacterium]
MSEPTLLSDVEREVLAERARALAMPPRAVGLDTADTVTFLLSRERYAISARSVFAVFRLASLVRLPGAQAPVVGVTRWRGDVLTLLDVRSLVGASTTALDDLAVVLVIGIDQPEFGILADALDPTIALEGVALLPPVGRPAPSSQSVIRGVTRDGLLVLDAAALVARQVGTTPSHSSIPSPLSSASSARTP